MGEKEDLQLCAQRLAAVCAALRTEGSAQIRTVVLVVKS